MDDRKTTDVMDELKQIVDDNAIQDGDPDPENDCTLADEDDLVTAPEAPQQFRSTQGLDFLENQ